MIRQESDGETVIRSQDERAYLRLDSEGFTAVSTRGKEKRFAWTAVSGFKPANVGTKTPDSSASTVFQVGLFLADPPKKGRVGRWIVRHTYGVDDTVPGVYPNIEEVVALLERWRERYGGR